jgi:PPOX class probable F420-dependent enzyme
MELTTAIAFAKQHSRGVVTTIRRDGRPQLSNVGYGFDGDDVRLSVTDTRAKTHNARRDPRVSLYVVRDDFWAYAVLDGTATLSAVAARPDDAVNDELVDMYRKIAGEHPDWDEFRQAMVEEGRLVMRIRFERAYGTAG